MGNVEALQSLSETIRLLSEGIQTKADFKLDTAETESLVHYMKRVHARLQTSISSFNAAVQALGPRINSIMHNLNENEQNSYD